ncbi:MAG TPA: hypothetical protein VFM01_05615 [Nakamurella sp.]|nr:hypothetical protein [Nakamurella sp.]
MYDDDNNWAWGLSGDELDLPALGIQLDEEALDDEHRGRRVEGGTRHRLAGRGSALHHNATVPTGGQVMMAFGDPAAVGKDLRLAPLVFDLTDLVEQLLAGAQPCRLTLVCGLINDPARVEIVHGVAVGLEWPEEHEGELVRFEDGDYVYLDDVISVRVEAA